MMYYIRSTSTDATFNLALEQYVFDHLDRTHSYLMLWQNANAIIIGKHQNTRSEVNAEYVKESGIQVVRRLSGGGAVYHDMGNVNFTFITDAKGENFNLASFCHPVIRVLQSLGVKAQISGRNDMTIEGMKFSGNSQYIKQGRMMHHGTILFDSDLTVLSKALSVSKDKIESKGLKSVRNPVTNVRPHMSRDCDVKQFFDFLETHLMEQFDAQVFPPHLIDPDAVRRLQTDVYGTWEWNYGYSPAYSINKKRRFDAVGSIEIQLDAAEGTIRNLAFFGDYFAVREDRELIDRLTGVPLNEKALTDALCQVTVDFYFRNLKKEQLISLLLE